MYLLFTSIHLSCITTFMNRTIPNGITIYMKAQGLSVSVIGGKTSYNLSVFINDNVYLKYMFNLLLTYFYYCRCEQRSHYPYFQVFVDVPCNTCCCPRLKYSKPILTKIYMSKCIINKHLNTID